MYLFNVIQSFRGAYRIITMINASVVSQNTGLMKKLKKKPRAQAGYDCVFSRYSGG